LRKLTKEDLLQGVNRRETLVIKEEYGGGVKIDGEVVIRPLSDGELSKIISMLGPIPIAPDGTLDTSKVEVNKNFEALRLATSMGLIEPKLSLEDVEKIPYGLPEFIGNKILEISGIMPPEMAKKKEAK
jgi:hypothetical protein